MSFLKKILSMLFVCEQVGDMAQHRVHTTKYEDLCK
jgi:hypothetical protein